VSDLNDVVAALITCVRDALAATAAGAPDRVCDVPGQLAWDACDCGVLAVTVTRMYPSVSFPQAAAGAALVGPCPPPYEATDLTVTVLRCAPSMDGYGNPPSCDLLDAATLTWTRDLDATRRALACCLVDLRDADTIVDFMLGESTPAGPEGGCVGVDTHLTVGLVNCLCPVG
jgi:hypothetical protein